MHPKRYFVLSWFDIGITFEDCELVYSRSSEMNRQQTYKGSGFYVGWMRGMRAYDDSLSLGVSHGQARICK